MYDVCYPTEGADVAVNGRETGGGDAIIVGAGQSGYVVATTLRKLQPDRRIVVLGDEDHVPYERPPLSKDVLLDERSTLPVFLPAAEYSARGIELATGVRVSAIDREGRRVVLADGSVHPYGTLVLTPGSRPLQLAIEGAAHLRYLRTFRDAVHVRQRLAPGSRLLCIGAGVIGMELAATARRRGAEVVVVEAGSSVMARCLPAPERDFLRALHEAQGIEFRFGTTVTALCRDGDGERTHARLGTGEVIEADIVVAGIGIVRNDDLARDSGLEVDRGVLVNEYGRTSDDAIYCAGDAAAFWHPRRRQRMRLESWHHALEHASSVAHAIVDGSTAYAPVPRFWTDQHDLNVHVVGDHAEAVAVFVEGERGERKYTATYLDADGRIVAAVCVNDVRRVRPLLIKIAEREKASAAIAAAALPF